LFQNPQTQKEKQFRKAYDLLKKEAKEANSKLRLPNLKRRSPTQKGEEDDAPAKPSSKGKRGKANGETIESALQDLPWGQILKKILLQGLGVSLKWEKHSFPLLSSISIILKR